MSLVKRGPVSLVEQQPADICRTPDGSLLFDFGKVAFGNLSVKWPPGFDGKAVLHFGEALSNGCVDRAPPGTVRYARVETDAGKGSVVAPPPDAKNTRPVAVATPPEWGVLIPFRWVELEGWPEEAALDLAQTRRRAAFARDWNDDASAFTCSDPLLTKIWDLSRYSIKATTFAGVYVDGDRERIAYEGDAYLNQISHQACDPDPTIARATFDYLLEHPTWPTEWALHMPFMAHADWMHTGDGSWLTSRYDSLLPKLLPERLRTDGLLMTPPALKERDLVDWPRTERDGYVFTDVNAVVNAFYIEALKRMSVLAAAIGRQEEAGSLRARAAAATTVFHSTFLDESRRLFVDGDGTDHASQHANFFPLAFNLVPARSRKGVLDHVLERGMACSVYGAQYLLEALFLHGKAEAALALMTAEGDRSWRHMLDSGATITWEAWDHRYKPNLDWNHAWGAAPANLLPRFVAGVRVDRPGGSRIAVQPETGGLHHCSARIPTMRGPVEIEWSKDTLFRLCLAMPRGMSARLILPAVGRHQVRLNGQPITARQWRGRLVLPGRHLGTIEVTVG